MGCHKPLIQWIFQVPVKGGRVYITPQEAIYKWYISGIYCQLGDYILPTTLYRNLKIPLINKAGYFLGGVALGGVALGKRCDDYPHLEDHPRTCKWLITMVIVNPLTGVVGPLPNGLFMAYK